MPFRCRWRLDTLQIAAGAAGAADLLQTIVERLDAKRLDAEYLRAALRVWDAAAWAPTEPPAPARSHHQVRFAPGQIAGFLAFMWVLLIAFPLKAPETASASAVCPRSVAIRCSRG